MALGAISVLLDEPIALIRPELHGQFAEHLGGCVNGGLWVGENSSIPNFGGLRTDVLNALKRLRIPVLRWPGGCFADDYHWEDGIGPRKDRPRRVNTWWGMDIEDNAFGTHEFLMLCRHLGCQPFLAGNVGSGSPREMRDWVEYCNFASDSTLARRRARNGSPQPLGVRYWGVGNEAWGCGGNFCPEDYGAQYKRFATYLRDFPGAPLFLIACGPDGNKPDWTRRFLRKIASGDARFNYRIHGLGAHYYCGTAGPSATEFDVNQWYELLHKAAGVEQLIREQRAAMDEFDPQRKIGLLIDEWGTWHFPTPGRDPGHLWQQNTLRDALAAALTLDTFHRHADQLVMANIAQLVNVLQAMVLTEGEKMILTPTYYVFDLYQPHQGGRSVRTVFDVQPIRFAAADTMAQLSGLSGSASVRANLLTLTVVNPHASLPQEARIDLAGRPIGRATSSTLSDDDLAAHNSFAEPNRISPSEQALEIEPGDIRHVFPPASVTRLQLALG
jgi:alpha-N-arabinofuranosidase